ncbi:MAG: glutaminyl-peptide cyclotransferase, partial [Candidatus Eisenbacteria bacterium]|nr:glutaminyl-peptide cyclotransferase [Candidatus Eisenbacteria bacterium]
MKTLRNALFITILAFAPTLLGCGESVDPEDTPKTPSATPVYGYQVVHTYPHQPDAFTQGLVIEDGMLYESTGQYGASTVRRVDLETGEVIDQKRLDSKFFAEGLTFFENQLLQITWRENQGFIYNPQTLDQVGV